MDDYKSHLRDYYSSHRVHFTTLYMCVGCLAILHRELETDVLMAGLAPHARTKLSLQDDVEGRLVEPMAVYVPAVPRPPVHVVPKVAAAIGFSVRWRDAVLAT